MLSLLLSLIVSRVLSSLSLKTGMGSRTNTLQFRRKQLQLTPPTLSHAHGARWDVPKLAEVLAKPLSIIYQQPWSSRKLPDNWMRPTV